MTQVPEDVDDDNIVDMEEDDASEDVSDDPNADVIEDDVEDE